MEVAVFVDGFCFVIAEVYHCYRFVFKVDADAAFFSFHVYESDVVFREHRVVDATHFYLDDVIFEECHHRDVFFAASLDGVRDELFHFLAAAEDRNFRVDYFFNYVSAVIAFIKFCCHSVSFLIVNVSFFLFCLCLCLCLCLSSEF